MGYYTGGKAMDVSAWNEDRGVTSRCSEFFAIEVEYHSSFQDFHDLIVILV